MGYFIKKIAKDDKELMPATVSLAGNTNYMQFVGKERRGRDIVGFTMDYDKYIMQEWCTFTHRPNPNGDEINVYLNNRSAFAIRDKKTGIEYRIRGRYSDRYLIEGGVSADENEPDEDFIGYYTYVLDPDLTNWAWGMSIQTCLRSIDFFKKNVDVTLISDPDHRNKEYLLLTSKEGRYDLDLEIVIIEADYMKMEKIIFGSDDSFIDISRIDISMKIVDTNFAPIQTEFKIIEYETRVEHSFVGTKDEKKVNNDTFYLSEDTAVTAENIRACLMKNEFLNSNFNISIAPVWKDGELVAGDTIRIVSKEDGIKYRFEFKSELNEDFIRLMGDMPFWGNGDMLSGEKSECEIELDMYRNTGLFMGEEDPTAVGTYVATLSKTYFNKPLWFDVNVIAGDRARYSDGFLHAGGWCDAGTISDYRFIAKRFDGVNREMFYISDILYTINGYDRSLELNDMARYVYNASEPIIVLPLTKQPRLTHIKGQAQYFNFILSDPQRKDREKEPSEMGLFYRLYTQSGSFIAERKAHVQDISAFSIVNTIALNIDGAMEGLDNVGHVKVSLCRDGVTVSEPLEFDILPAFLYKVNDFAFLNSLGGWSSFSFGGTGQTEFKAKPNTIYKTQTPGYSLSADLESVFNKEVEEQFMVETMPVAAHVAEWLKEISASLAVFELSTKRYVIVDELNVKHNTKDDLFVLQMKYHYSDSYNGVNG